MSRAGRESTQGRSQHYLGMLLMKSFSIVLLTDVTDSLLGTDFERAEMDQAGCGAATARSATHTRATRQVRMFCKDRQTDS